METPLHAGAVPVPYGRRITVTARADDDCDCDALDSTSVTLGSDPCAPPRSSAGCLAGLEEQRNRFAASHADRFVASRAFTPLLCSWWAPTVKSKATALLLASALGDLPNEPEALGEEFAKRLAERGAEFEKGARPGDPVDLEAVRQVVAETYAEVYLPAEPEAAGRKEIGVLPGPEIAGWQVATASVRSSNAARNPGHGVSRPRPVPVPVATGPSRQVCKE